MNHTDQCPHYSLYFTLGHALGVTYFYLGGLYWLIGTSGQALNLWAFLSQSRTEKAYMYQLYVVIGELLDTTIFLAYTITLSLSGRSEIYDSADWFKQSYTLMYYVAHMAIPLSHGLAVTVLLLSISLVADRIFAFKKPFIYKNIQHRKHRLVALGCCVLIGFSSTLYNVKLYTIVPPNGTDDEYSIVSDTVYSTSPLGSTLAYTCNLIRLIGFMLLISSNIVLIKLYGQRVKKVSERRARKGSTDRDAQVETKAKATERTLFMLAITQSIFKGIRAFDQMAFYIATYADESFLNYEALLFGPLINIGVMICGIGDTCATMCINKRARMKVEKALGWLKKCKKTVESAPITPVTPVS